MENEVSYTLPSPTDTPYRTPSSSRSRLSHRYGSMSPSSSPPPLPSDERSLKRRSNDSSNAALDENISPLDPRRFTPTLHASLVSEILSLRREVENKAKDIDQLESSLHNTHRENERLNENLTSNNKETRSLKRQLQMLEGGNMTALNEMAKERDDALGNLAEMRRRLDQSQKRAKSHEDNAERTHSLWEREKENWGAERRTLETKVNVVEGRLKVVLNEVAISQFASSQPQNVEQFRLQKSSIPDSPGKRSMSVLSHRRYSGASNNSDQLGGRTSALGNLHGISTNLADELALDEEEEDRDGFAEDGRISPDALPEERERPTSRMSVKAQKILGLNLGVDESDPVDSPGRHRSFGRFSGLDEHSQSAHHASTVQYIETPKARYIETPKARYVDVAVQHSQPSSPKALPSLATSLILHTEILPVEPLKNTHHELRTSSIEPASPVSLAESFDSHVATSELNNHKSAPIMVSSSCQTIELLPSPPLTPEMANSELNVTRTDTSDRIATMSASTQTEPVLVQDHPDESKIPFTDVRKLPIPSIAIIPPRSRPATPETSVVLPPRTKNAGCQVTMQSYAGYSSMGMQTDDIKIDIRRIDLPPISTSSIMSQYKPPPTVKNNPSNSSRRRYPQVAPPTAMYDSRRTAIAEEPLYPPENDSGPLVKDFASNMTRPVRSSSLFAGFDDQKDNEFAQFDDDNFDEDDIFSRPTAKFTVRSGKLVSQDSGLKDIGESAAAFAGKAVAEDNLRMSEDSLPPEIRNNLSGRMSPRKRSIASASQYKQVRRVPSPKRNNIRRVALISSGAAAHSAQSSLCLSQDSGTSVDWNPPPFPVPIRFSSARVGKSISEGGRSSPASSAASPTKRDKHRNRKPLLRKVRSGPTVSPGPDGRRPRSRSPASSTRVSIVRDIPSFQMPVDNVSIRTYQQSVYPQSEASAPRPSIATGPNRKASHAKTNSDAVSMQQTSVVDAIAQTMIGEWMFKYVRRRKSFGMQESKTVDYDPSKHADEISATVTNTGVRHKRWVWLAPYERSVMWSSKQPTSNTALLGKSGRKLAIQSVLDVKDDNPMPKGSVTGSHFNRSILILTPDRALKFTALNQKRHYIWLTALSFLSHSPLSLEDLAALPPPPTGDGPRSLPSPSLAGSLHRRPIRDSIRIAKGAGRSAMRSFTTDGNHPVQVQGMVDRDHRSVVEEADYYNPMMDAALPPTIPRYSAHTRNRSNTAPKAPPTSFKSFLGSHRETGPPSLPVSGSGMGSTYSQSVGTGVSSERGVYTPSLGGLPTLGSKSSSRRGSEASAMSGGRPAQGLMGMYINSVNGGGGGTMNSGTSAPTAGSSSHPNSTMRMDAFIETRGTPKTQQGVMTGFFRSRHQGKRKDLGYWGVEEDASGNPRVGVGMENIILPGDIFGSTRMGIGSGYGHGYGHSHGHDVEVGGGDPFRGF